MNWIHKGQHYRETSCGKYAICRVTMYGLDLYEAWYRGKAGGRLVSDRVNTAEEAVQECEKHADSQICNQPQSDHRQGPKP